MKIFGYEFRKFEKESLTEDSSLYLDRNTVLDDKVWGED